MRKAIQQVSPINMLLMSAALMVHMTELLGINVHKALHI